MNWNFEDESKPYSSDDAIDDLEAVRAMLHEAQKKINRGKLESSDIGINISIQVEDNDKD
ncbi:hypothetical protein [Pseudobutyrivibrio sp. YE44]|uniref:hypothetical protein n=1 Tax=Pseudobutyrivibrio sp. YE44 TaxID=1520802 RepID=UPI000B85EEC8|nr:hypothetical protein [Pseudobutyrivibrio sp. YE44]